jgi:hypothetical protein
MSQSASTAEQRAKTKPLAMLALALRSLLQHWLPDTSLGRLAQSRLTG